MAPRSKYNIIWMQNKQDATVQSFPMTDQIFVTIRQNFGNGTMFVVRWWIKAEKGMEHYLTLSQVHYGVMAIFNKLALYYSSIQQAPSAGIEVSDYCYVAEAQRRLYRE